jgi:integrase
MLQDIEQSSERVKSGFVDEFVEAGKTPLLDLVSDYLDDMRLRGRSDRHRADTERLLKIVLKECDFNSLGSLNASKLDKYLARLKTSARTKNTHRQSVMGFANWCAKKGKLEYNPLARSTKPEGQAVLNRRALSIEELRRLLESAKVRALRERQMVRSGPNKGSTVGQVRSSVRERLTKLGQERALIYKAAFYTGFRRGELRDMRVYHLSLEGPKPKVHLPKELTKNGKDANIPLRLDFAEELRSRIEESKLTSADRVFTVPSRIALVMRKDLELAGIAYRDDRGRVADFHSLRKCMATHLNKEGVPIVTAKELLRHGTVELTAGVYNDEESHDLRAAVLKLPSL